MSAATQDSSRISSGSSSSLNLDSWDGIIDDYFDDVINNKIPQRHHSESNQGLSVTGTVGSPHPSSEMPAKTDLREIVVIHDSTTTEGSQDNPILSDSTAEHTDNPTIEPQNSRPRRNVGPPQFYGNHRFIDVVLETDDTGVSPSVFSSSPDTHRATFTVTSPSGLLTPLAEAPLRQILVAETTLSWSSKNSLPTVRPVTSPTKTHFQENSSGSNSAYQTTKDSLHEVDNCSEISSSIDSETRAKLDDFDNQFS